MTLTVDFTGSLAIMINGRTYNLTHNEPGKVEVIGARLFKATPDVSVKALSDSKVKSLRVELYDCGRV